MKKKFLKKKIKKLTSLLNLLEHDKYIDNLAKQYEEPIIKDFTSSFEDEIPTKNERSNKSMAGCSGLFGPAPINIKPASLATGSFSTGYYPGDLPFQYGYTSAGPRKPTFEASIGCTGGPDTYDEFQIKLASIEDPLILKRDFYLKLDHLRGVMRFYSDSSFELNPDAPNFLRAGELEDTLLSLVDVQNRIKNRNDLLMKIKKEDIKCQSVPTLPLVNLRYKLPTGTVLNTFCGCCPTPGGPTGPYGGNPYSESAMRHGKLLEWITNGSSGMYGPYSVPSGVKLVKLPYELPTGYKGLKE